MKFLILGESMDKLCPDYRGTYRAEPYYQNELSENHPINEAFFWYVNILKDAWTSPDIKKAHQLIQLYDQFSPNQHFELIVATKEKEKLAVEADFLGFDLSAGFHYSLLSWGLDICVPTKDRSDVYANIQPLICLTERFFRPQLNSNGLFDNYDIARFCLDCMLSLQAIQPNLWESDATKFEITAIWKM